MRSSKGLGLVLLSIILALYLGGAFAERPYDKANATEPLNSTNATRNISQDEKTPFSIADDASHRTAPSINSSGIVAKIFEAHPPKMTTFVIEGALTRIINATKMDQSSLNAAILKHGVEETPHGHVTYYN